MKDDLIFAGNLPVVIKKNGETSDLFAPLRSSSCDITIVSNKILSDLYTNDKKSINVKVEKVMSVSETSTLFEGYATPNTYSQPLSPNLDNIDITAIDPISMLKYLYVDDILEKAKTITMGDLVGKALAAVKVNINEVLIEKTVGYDSEYVFEELLVQTNNFWDEMGDASTVYDALSECLRLFGYTLAFCPERDRYIIYTVIADHDFATYRDFARYFIEDGGTLRYMGSYSFRMSDFKFQYSVGEWTAIDDNTTMSIGETYDRIEGVASTKIPDFSLTAFDLVSSEERDKYSVGDVNIQLNKIKGYNMSSANSGGGKLMEDDIWYYLWNGVYINPDFDLDIDDGEVNGYANINGAYEYMTGETGHPDASGGILNFYGGDTNPYGEGKDPLEERSVEVKQCITVFAPDNGLAPEFLEREDLSWEFDYTTADDYNPATLQKKNTTDAKYGENRTGVANAISYRQKYENITMDENTPQTLTIDLMQCYSRTGINQKFNVSNYSTVDNRYFKLKSYEDDYYFSAYLVRGDAYTYPWTWQASNVVVDYGYFDKYSTSGKLLPVWDKRRVIVFVRTSGGAAYQFNGKEWVETTYITHANSFYLCKLMNYEKIFADEFYYDMIQCSDGNMFALNEDGFKYYTDKYGGVVNDDTQTEHKFEYYGKYGNDWLKYIDDVGEGRLSLILPAINDINCLVECDIYHSSLLGMTGNATHGGAYNTYHSINYKIEGTVIIEDEQGGITYTALTEDMIGDSYGRVVSPEVDITWMPINATYVKAEHLDLDISLSVPESNLGQMFGESDIRYQTAPSKKFRESYDVPPFLVNTKHSIVGQSHSYVIAGTGLADPDKFSIGWSYNKIACRPENYVMQGYKNLLGSIRKTYSRTLVPHKDGFGNVMTYIEVPDIPDEGNGRWLMVVSDSVDVKTNRHTITAIEDYGLNVDTINNYTVIEIPRKSRNPRYDLPSVQKHK